MDKNNISLMLDGLDKYPFHMPGHKRNAALMHADFPYERDITEIEGSDNLHSMSGVILAECERAARLWGAVHAHVLVNGSTCGILAAIRAYAGHDRSVIMARNCHKSVYNGVELCRLRPTYLYPEIDAKSGICGSITPAQVAHALQSAPDAKLVILTSPTYEGVISDIAGICREAHAHGALVLVDAAHGAHLGLGTFGRHPISCGADVVICSLHKTLPSPTQTALALIGQGCPSPEKLGVQLAVFETSSPSYVLMEQAAQCIRLMETDGHALLQAWKVRLDGFARKTAGLAHLRVLFGKDLPACVWAHDASKIVISTRGTKVSGQELARLLRDRNKIEIEMASSDYIVAMTSLADTDDGFERLAQAICEIDARLEACGAAVDLRMPEQQAVLAPWQAEDFSFADVDATKAPGRVSAEYVWAYPPGIPLIVPGERYDAAALDVLHAMKNSGVTLDSTSGGAPCSLRVLEENQ